MRVFDDRAAWHSFRMDEVEYRREGCELVPFDILWEGWLSEEGLPVGGHLQVDVLPLHDHECGWMRNISTESSGPKG